MEAFDAPVVPKSGMVRIRITAVHTASRYYGIIDFHFLLFFFLTSLMRKHFLARILKWKTEGGKLIDMSGSHFEVSNEMRKYYQSKVVEPVQEKDIEVGNWYTRRSADGLFERVRVEEILNYNHQVHNFFIYINM